MPKQALRNLVWWRQKDGVAAISFTYRSNCTADDLSTDAVTDPGAYMNVPFRWTP